MINDVKDYTFGVTRYLEKVENEDISADQDVQRAFCWDNHAINELIKTYLDGGFVPQIILAEIIKDDFSYWYIVDGVQRTNALNLFRYGNYKITRAIDDSIVRYPVKLRDENGNYIRNADNTFQIEYRTFDIKNKTYEQLPDELKKQFDDYQMRFVLHRDCTMEEVSKLVRRYNSNRSMSVNQKALTYMPNFARWIKNAVDNEFYKECVSYSDAMHKNGTYEQNVINSVTTVFHLDDWKKAPKDRNIFLDNNTSREEIDTIAEYGNRIAEVCEDNFTDIFCFKNIAIWFALFHRFTRLGLSDERFADFLDEFRNTLHSKEINGNTFDELDVQRNTNNKVLVVAKIDLLTSLMHEYFGIENNVDASETNDEDNSFSETISENNNIEETHSVSDTTLDANDDLTNINEDTDEDFISDEQKEIDKRDEEVINFKSDYDIILEELGLVDEDSEDDEVDDDDDDGDNKDSCLEDDMGTVLNGDSNESEIMTLVKEVVDENIEKEDVEFYETLVDDCVKIDSPVYLQARTALVALMAYACKRDLDTIYESWISKYQNNNGFFSKTQKVNYQYMKKDFDKFAAA